MNIVTHNLELPGPGAEPLRMTLRWAKAAGKDPLPAVVICHGFKGFKDWGFFPFIAASLAELGYLAVTFNFTHAGIGERPEAFDRLDLFEKNTWTRELHDLTAVTFALMQGPLAEVRADRHRLAVFGHSRGGAIAILHAAMFRSWSAVMTLASIATLDRFSTGEKAQLEREGSLPVKNARTGQIMPVGRVLELDRMANYTDLDVPRAAGGLDVPLLLLHGTEDSSVPYHDAEILRESCPLARLVPLEGADHTLGCKHPFAGTTPHLERALATMRGFLEETIR